jgi:hypothetical protein
MTQDGAQHPTYELQRACPSVPLATDGSELPAQDMPPGLRVTVDEERDGHLVVSAVGSSPSQIYRYLVTREALSEAISDPDLLPREGQAPTASSNTAGSPD